MDLPDNLDTPVGRRAPTGRPPRSSSARPRANMQPAKTQAVQKPKPSRSRAVSIDPYQNPLQFLRQDRGLSTRAAAQRLNIKEAAYKKIEASDTYTRDYNRAVIFVTRMEPKGGWEPDDEESSILPPT